MNVSPLRLNALTKQYGTQRGVQSLSLELKTGEVFGFLGPNGAGKTTAIRTIMNFLRPTSGSAQILGLDSVADSTKVKASVGYLAGDFELYANLTGRQYLSFIANLRGIQDVDEQIQALAERLEANLEKRIETLSRGNTQKIALIAALLHDPELLILDEPTTGLDPLMQNRFYELIRERTKRGKTVFMSSHILSEVQAICDRVAFMRGGSLVEVVDIHAFRKSHKKEVRLTTKKGTKPMQIPQFRGLEVLTHTKSECHFITTESSKELLRWLSVQPVDDVIIQDVSLEDMFLKLYGMHEGAADV